MWAGVSDVRAEVSRGGPHHPEGRWRGLLGAGKQHLSWAETQARLQTAGPAGSRQRTRGWHLFNVTGCMLVYISSQLPQRSMSSLSICLSGTPALWQHTLDVLEMQSERPNWDGLDVDSEGAQKGREEENVTKPRGRHKRRRTDLAKEGVKLIGAPQEDADKSFRWS